MGGDYVITGHLCGAHHFPKDPWDWVVSCRGPPSRIVEHAFHEYLGNVNFSTEKDSRRYLGTPDSMFL